MLATLVLAAWSFARLSSGGGGPGKELELAKLRFRLGSSPASIRALEASVVGPFVLKDPLRLFVLPMATASVDLVEAQHEETSSEMSRAWSVQCARELLGLVN